MSNRNSLIRDQIDLIAAQATEGDECYEECRWTALRIAHVGEFSYVEAKSQPDTSYDRHVFVVRYRNHEDTPTLLGEYVGDGNEWSLLAASPDAPSGWQALFPAEQFTVRPADIAADKRTQLIRQGFPDRFEKLLCEIICSYGFSDTDADDTYETVKKQLSWIIIDCVHVGKYTYLHVDSGYHYPQFVIVVQFKDEGEPWMLGYYEQTGFRPRWKLRESNTEADDSEWEQSFPEEELGIVGTDIMQVIFAPLIFFSPFYLAFLGWLWWFSDFSTVARILLTALPPIVVVVLSVLQMRDEIRGREEERTSHRPHVLEWQKRNDPRTIRRIVLGIGLGVAFVTLLIGTFLALVFSGQENLLTSPAVMACMIPCPFVAVLSFCSAFSWALFYRCPQCKERIAREQNSYGRNYGHNIFSLRYFCHRCGVEWHIFWPDGEHSDDLKG